MEHTLSGIDNFFIFLCPANLLYFPQINFICCAKALCNLACADQVRHRVAKEGGMHALMMISMVNFTLPASLTFSALLYILL
jgi:hypothetical protein